MRRGWGRCLAVSLEIRRVRLGRRVRRGRRGPMINEKTQLGAMAAALADLNEMRLSKFEYALVTAKLMEVPRSHPAIARPQYARYCGALRRGGRIEVVRGSSPPSSWRCSGATRILRVRVRSAGRWAQ